jgi:hypothetical protein
MSGKGNTSKSSGNQTAPTERPPEIVTGWQYHTYAQNSNRYMYIGKDDDGEPEFLDYGPQGGRSSERR